MNRRSIATTAAVTVVLGLAGCSASGGSGSTTVTPSLSAIVASPTPTPSSTPSPTAVVVAAGGACSLIDQSTATQVLGADPGPGKGAGGLGENGGITKVDGCTYVAGGSHLGYDVLIIKGVPPTAMLSRAKSKLKAEAAAGGAKEFSTGLADSVGFTFKVGTGVNSEIAVISGDNWVTVAVSRKDGDAAKTKTAVTAAAQAILASL